MYIDNNLYDRIEKATKTTYSNDRSEDNVWVGGDNLYTMIEDLICEIEHLKAREQYILKDVEDNFEISTNREAYIGKACIIATGNKKLKPNKKLKLKISIIKFIL